MTNPKPPEVGTAVTKLPKTSLTELMVRSPDAESRILAYRAAQHVERSKIIHEAAQALAGTQWGKAISPAAQAAVAKWAFEAGIDPVRHIYILGGKIYDNAELYFDKLAADPNFDHAEVTLLAPLDTRKISTDLGLSTEDVAALKSEQHKMNAERLRLQMEWSVPANINEFQKSAAAALVTLFFKDDTQAIGVNWAGTMGRGKGDPVGDSDPVKTAITRAFRKAAKQKVPVWFKAGEIGDNFERAEQMIEQGRSLARSLPASIEVPGMLDKIEGGAPAVADSLAASELAAPEDGPVVQGDLTDEERRVREEDAREAAREA